MSSPLGSIAQIYVFYNKVRISLSKGLSCKIFYLPYCVVLAKRTNKFKSKKNVKFQEKINPCEFT